MKQLQFYTGTKNYWFLLNSLDSKIASTEIIIFQLNKNQLFYPTNPTILQNYGVTFLIVLKFHSIKKLLILFLSHSNFTALY